MKKAYLSLLLIASSAFVGCQKDIPVLGQEEGGVTPKSEVFIRAIILHSFPERDTNTHLPWDDGLIQPFDSSDWKGPDIYYYIYYYNPDNELPPISYKQLSHFSDVLPLNPDSPLVYTLTVPFQIISEYIDTTFYLRIYDYEYGILHYDSTLIDSLPFTIGPDFSQEDPYFTSISSTGFSGSQVTLSLEWK